MVKMESFHIFTLNEKRGYILSTSFEEADRDIEATIENLSGYDFLVFACQGLRLIDVHKALKKAAFIVKDVRIQSVHEAPAKAKEVLNFLNSN
jgi:hypothetical protein